MKTMSFYTVARTPLRNDECDGGDCVRNAMGSMTIDIQFESDQMRARDFLARYRECGPYTAIRTCKGGTHLALMPLHLDRLYNGALFYDTLLANGTVRKSVAWGDKEKLEEGVQRTAASALTAYLIEHRRDVESKNSRVGGVVECCVPQICSQCKDGVRTSDNVDLAGLAMDFELMVIIVLDLKNGLILAVASKMPQVSLAGIAVEIRPGERRNPRIKDSLWVHDRQILLQDRHEEAVETILAAPLDGRASEVEWIALEGSVSNLFVVSGEQIYTAPCRVLEGTLRQVILDVCKENHIPVNLDFAKLATADSWDECFITSEWVARGCPTGPVPNKGYISHSPGVVRVIQPVARIFFSPGATEAIPDRASGLKLQATEEERSAFKSFPAQLIQQTFPTRGPLELSSSASTNSLTLRLRSLVLRRLESSANSIAQMKA